MPLKCNIDELQALKCILRKVLQVRKACVLVARKSFDVDVSFFFLSKPVGHSVWSRVKRASVSEH